MSIFHDEVEIEDFEYDEEEEVYYYPCPCGDRFQISKVSFEVRKLIFIPNRNNSVFAGRIISWRGSSNMS